MNTIYERRQYNCCGYCGMQGHSITTCHSSEGMRLFSSLKSRSIDYIVQDIPVHNRASLFFTHLKNRYYAKELRYILAKFGCVTNGTKIELSARIVHKYFLLDLALQQFPELLYFDDRDDMDEYLKFWLDISRGTPLEDAAQALDRYFETVANLELQEGDMDDQHFEMVLHKPRECKFPIRIWLETNHLTQSEESTCFECAICMEEDRPLLDKVDMSCNHSFCKDCVDKVLQTSQTNQKHPCCALCRTDFTNITVRTCNVLEDFNKKYCLTI